MGEHFVLDGRERIAVTDSAGTVKHWNLLAGGVIGRSKPVDEVRRYYNQGSPEDRAAEDNILGGFQR